MNQRLRVAATKPIAIVLVIGLVLIAWRWHHYQRLPEPVLRAAASVPAEYPPFTVGQHALSDKCPPPGVLATPMLPAQSAAPAQLPAFAHDAGKLKPLAGFSVDARVLSARHYSEDREAEFAPLDLALGWARMRDDDVVSAFDIGQANRWYYLRWGASPPISIEQARRESANMHLIPANRRIAETLATVQTGQRIRIDGWLVEAHSGDGWRWRSSLSRDDHGPGGCELVYVCAIAIAQ